MTDLNKEREAFLNTFQYYKGRRDIIFSHEHELFMTRSNNPSEIAQKEISNMNSRWDAWLRCAKHRDAELEKAKAQAVPEWISVDDRMPESLRNVLVLIDANPVKNQNQMVAHFIPKFTEEYHGDDDWYDYDEDRGCGYVKEGWYANTAYIGDEYSSYFIEEKVTHWTPLKEASESGAEG
ncbi:DUF551 domain-containing protein [Acinetobacter baumannii]|uniref:DUF551 domain-containing protein n=2 Tax=Acinetobacter baumannii TaxID=470 RepID=A0A836LYU0_ACIBA|nr:DUF551 domain-containing protein [Acinetobacter baumannii]KCX59135.1 hypothetical protein J524_0845 [Acinetobacter baumannii 496487]EXC35904.1 hypothetical protein J552_3989 [Acinetobacter baumannii 951631]EXG10625.1 hypothetical protein J712_2388 [Acinetobacter baumannii 722310]EXI01466.1 hypothetical protein J618_1472 [Acinetobacter baumannii 607805]EXI04920.1 hypothetical protein J639_1612 [Acinetobacter baumannii 457946]